MICSPVKCFEVIAPLGQAAAHTPQPLQLASLMVATFFSSLKEMALKEQSDMQVLQPNQTFPLLTETIALISTFPLLIIARALAAPAED